MPKAPTLLFTAFEPSGDEHAAPVIAALKRRNPELAIWALGGPAMRAAGAQLIEDTTEHPVMFFAAIAQATTHLRRVARLKRWLADHPIDVLVPTDSPAANWSICSAVRRAPARAKIIHLVAPQLWAWASWRIRKMRRLSDHVLCLLPFEKPWFEQRGMPASFVGHPAYDHLRRQPPVPELLETLPDGSVRIALLPGSRPGEISKNWPVMLDAFQRLRQTHPDLVAAVAAYKDGIADQIRTIARKRTGCDGLPPGMVMHTAATATILHWSQLVFVTSGTATLHAAAHQKPMVAMYSMNPVVCLLLHQFLVKARTFTLPNLIAEMDGPRAIPELIPYFGDGRRLASTAEPLIRDPAQRQVQIEQLRRVDEKLAGHDFPILAVEKIIEVGGLN